MKTFIALLVLCVPVHAQIRSNTVTILPKTDLSATGSLLFRDKQSTPHSLIFKAPTTVPADLTFLWPSVDGTVGQCLKTDGAGVFSFGSCTGGSVTLPLTKAVNIGGGGGPASTICVTDEAVGLIEFAANYYACSGTLDNTHPGINFRVDPRLAGEGLFSMYMQYPASIASGALVPLVRMESAEIASSLFKFGFYNGTYLQVGNSSATGTTITPATATFGGTALFHSDISTSADGATAIGTYATRMSQVHASIVAAWSLQLLNNTPGATTGWTITPVVGAGTGDIYLDIKDDLSNPFLRMYSRKSAARGGWTEISSSFYPTANQTFSLGSPGLGWSGLYLAGSVFSYTALGPVQFQGGNSRGTAGSPTATLNGDSLVSLQGVAYTGSAWTNPTSSIIVRAADNISSGAQGSFITFNTTHTADVATNIKNRATISADTSNNAYFTLGDNTSTFGGFRWNTGASQLEYSNTPTVLASYQPIGTATFPVKPAHNVYAGPATVGTAIPIFRILVTGDMPVTLTPFKDPRLSRFSDGYRNATPSMCNGISRPLSTFYSLLSDAQADFPLSDAAYGIALTDEVDWAAIQESILLIANNTTSGASGQSILLPAGLCLINKTINIGDGTFSAASSYQGISLIGQGSGTTRTPTVGSNLGATTLKWTGASSSTAAIIKVNGPIGAVHIERMMLHGNDLAGYAIDSQHAYNYSYEHLIVHMPQTAGIRYNAYGTAPSPAPALGSVGITRDVIIKSLNQCSAIGFDIGNTTAPSGGLDVASSIWEDINVTGNPSTCSGSDNRIAIRLNYTDSNRFINVNTGLTGHSIVFKVPNGAAAAPWQNSFFNTWLDHTPELDQTNGTWAPTVLHGAVFMNFGDDGGVACPTFGAAYVRCQRGDGASWGKWSYNSGLVVSGGNLNFDSAGNIASLSTVWNAMQSQGGVRAANRFWAGFSPTYDPIGAPTSILGQLALNVGDSVIQLQRDGGFSGLVADAYGSGAVAVIKGRQSPTVVGSPSPSAAGNAFLAIGGHGCTNSTTNCFTTSANVQVTLGAAQAYGSSSGTQILFQNTQVNTTSRIQTSALYTDTNGFPTQIYGNLQPNTLIATPGAYAAGCVRFNSGTNKLQFSHDCNTFADMGSGAGGITSINTVATGPGVTITGGSGISVGTVGNTVTITNTGGGGGGVTSVSAASASNGIVVSPTTGAPQVSLSTTANLTLGGVFITNSGTAITVVGSSVLNSIATSGGIVATGAVWGGGGFLTGLGGSVVAGISASIPVSCGTLTFTNGLLTSKGACP
jgi:hypothetical protein